MSTEPAAELAPTEDATGASSDWSAAATVPEENAVATTSDAEGVVSENTGNTNVTSEALTPENLDQAMASSEVAPSQVGAQAEESELLAAEESDDNPQEWLALDALGALDGEAVGKLAQYFEQAGDEEKAVYTFYLRAAQALTYSLTPIAPPPALRETIMQITGMVGKDGGHHYGHGHVGVSRRVAEKLGWPESRLLKLFLILTTGAAIALGALAWRQHALTEIFAKSAMEAENKRLAEFQARTEVEHRLALVTPRDLRVTEMIPPEQGGTSAGRLYWSQFGRRGLLWVHPKEPLGKADEFALWVVANEQPQMVYRWTGTDEFHEIASLQSGRPIPIQAFYIVRQPKGTRDPQNAVRLLVGNPYM